MGHACTSLLRAKAEPPPWPEPVADQPPEVSDEALAAAYSCEVLRTTTGLVRGVWAQFEAVEFWRPLPGGDDAKRTIRHLLILALELTTYAEREGELVEGVALGEGSYARVFGAGQIAARLISNRERPWVHRAAASSAREADKIGLGPLCYGYGRVRQIVGGHFEGTVVFQERLEDLGENWSSADTVALLDDVRRFSMHAFHNDVKLPNVARRSGRPRLIDFDLMSRWSLKLAVSSECIEKDFEALLAPQGEELASNFREYVDLFAFTLTLEDGRVFQAVFQRLLELWCLLETPVLMQLPHFFKEGELQEVPFEVLARVPVEAVSVHLLDLRGNFYAHIAAARHPARLAYCVRLPQLVRSNGVYWPDSAPLT